MALKLDDKFVRSFVSDEEIKAITPDVEAAVATLRNRTGAGSEMLGWLDLPENYDKEEYARINKEILRSLYRYRYRRILSWRSRGCRVPQVSEI